MSTNQPKSRYFAVIFRLDPNWSQSWGLSNLWGIKRELARLIDEHAAAGKFSWAWKPAAVRWTDTFEADAMSDAERLIEGGVDISAAVDRFTERYRYFADLAARPGAFDRAERVSLAAQAATYARVLYDLTGDRKWEEIQGVENSVLARLLKELRSVPDKSALTETERVTVSTAARVVSGRLPSNDEGRKSMLRLLVGIVARLAYEPDLAPPSEVVDP